MKEEIPENNDIEKYKQLVHKKVDETENIKTIIKVLTILRYLK